MKKILFICPYPPGLAPSQRFRYEQYLSQLREKSFYVSIFPFFTEKKYRTIYQSGNLLSKIYAITISYLSRTLLLFRAARYDFIFIHREAAPAGPPVFEFVLCKLLRKKIIYDFDDAIWLTDKEHEGTFHRFIRCRWKVRYICKWSYRVSCGNKYLADYARQFNSEVVINPTTIDIAVHREATNTGNPPTIGWTGSRSTLKYLTGILPVLLEIELRFPEAIFLIIADRKPELPLRNFVFKQWRKETEISDLSVINIGLMPMPDDPWTRGKCGFKALQYMAVGIPALVSPVGVNKEIVTDGIEGYWCYSHDDWISRIEELILNPAKRFQMGKEGRRTVINHYSTVSNADNFVSLFQ